MLSGAQQCAMAPFAMAVNHEGKGPYFPPSWRCKLGDVKVGAVQDPWCHFGCFNLIGGSPIRVTPPDSVGNFG